MLGRGGVKWGREWDETVRVELGGKQGHTRFLPESVWPPVYFEKYLQHLLRGGPQQFRAREVSVHACVPV